MSAFITGIIIGAILGALIRQFWPKRKPSTLHQPESDNKYGHPWSPVKELRRELPHPPPGFAWEIKVNVDHRGDHTMTLTLVDVATGTNTDSKSVNLTRYQPHGTTWAQFYRSYRIIARGHFDRYIIGALTDWAVEQVNKRRAGETSEYRMEA